MGCGSSRSLSNYEVDVDNMWDQANRTVEKNRSREKKLVVKRAGWKTVRIFVSSTFKDFHAEREVLIKQVFPDLRHWCEKRRIHLVECDLRWGVPKDTTTEETLRICLGEIDRCYSDNIMPFFLNLTSERCGWIPNVGDVPSSIVEEYRWIAGLSVTEMEIMHGAYRKDNPNSLFMLRESSFLESVPQTQQEQFVDANPLASQKLKILKENIRKRFPANQVSVYKCKYDRIDNEGKIYLKGLDSDKFSQKVFEFFKHRIEEQYPLDEYSASDPYQQAHDSHEAFMKSRSVAVLGRNEILKKIEDYIEQPSSGAPLVLLGGPGSGKSSIMARIADVYTTKAQERNIPGAGGSEWVVFYHFVGAVPGSTDQEKSLKRLLKELGSVSDATMPTDLDNTCQLLSGVLTSTNTRPVIIIIDALNQFDDDRAATVLRWLPKIAAPQVRVIISMINNTPPHRMLQERSEKPIELKVTPLDIKSRQEIVREILGKYNKRLDDQQMNLLMSKEASQNPLWLSIACEELRVFGLFQKVTEKIESFADGLLELLEQVLDRFERENGGELLVATLCLLETSVTGLLETELLTILGDEDNLVVKVNNNTAVKKNETKKRDVGPLPAVKWAVVYRALRPFLRPFGDSGEGRLDFYHRSLSKAVRRKYFLNPDDVEDDEDSKDKYYWWYRNLADFFEICENLERKIEEYPHHLIKTKQEEKLSSFLTQWKIFDLLYNEEWSSDLLRFWRQAGGAKEMVKCYQAALDNLKNMAVSQEELALRYEQVARIMLQEFQLDPCFDLAQKAMQLEENQLGARPERMVELYNLLATIVKEKTMGVYVSASQRPNMRKAMDLRAESIKIRETLTGRMHEFKRAHSLMKNSYDMVRWARVGGDYSFSAEEALEKSLKEIKIAEEMFTELNEEGYVAECLMTEGLSNLAASQYEEAERLLKVAKELSIRVYGEYSVLHARVMHNIGIVYEEQNMEEEAYDSFMESLKLKKEVYGKTHNETNRVRSLLQERWYCQRISQQRGDIIE